jgi:hypothetical protein
MVSLNTTTCQPVYLSPSIRVFHPPVFSLRQQKHKAPAAPGSKNKMDDNITSLQQAKYAFAKENNIEPCTNDKCGFSGCTCGKK